MADREYLTSQTYSATIGGTVYNVSMAMSGTATPTGWYNVTAYGAVGDGATDDAGSIEAAAAAASAAGGVLVFPKGTYAISAGIYIPSGCDIQMEGPIEYQGSGDEVAVTIGEAANPNSLRKIDVWVTRDSETDWTGDTAVGVRLVNSTTCDINVRHVQYFTTGVQCYGDGRGFAYNNVTLGQIERCATSIELTNANSGWCNQNNFYGGRISGPSAGANIANARTGIKITSSDASYTTNNNNNFFGTSIELSPFGTTGVPTPIHIEYGQENAFYGVRSEQKALPASDFVLVENSSSRNVFDFGFDNASGVDINYTDTSDYPSSIITYRRNVVLEQSLCVWNSGNLAELAYEYNGSGNVAFRGLHVSDNGQSTIARHLDSFTVSGKDIITTDNSKTIGVLVDTTRMKRFVVRRNVVNDTYPGRIAIRCYDASGTILEDSGGAGGEEYVKGLSNNPLTYVATPKWYRTGADSLWDAYVTVTADVKFVGVEIGAGAGVMHISSFSIESLDRSVAVSTWSGVGNVLTGGDHNNMLATAAPATAGTGIYYEAGTRIYNEAPGVGSAQGWVCTVAGAPGTWVAMPNL